ncbi:putative PA14 domain-containing protein [Seiridium cardinale]|uniref:PA14 domain-containing protein n=1 Tax=Seiridium cardinale TaxID=138064 RepID=A0ABR2Y4Q6_9PEZI
MRGSMILAALPLLASASPLDHADLEERGNSFCAANAFIISALKFEAGATSYCMSHLSMGTKTITSTATLTPSRIYSNRSVTVAASARITTDVTTLTRFTNDTTIGTVFSTVTQTVTNSAQSTQTCYAAPVLPKRHGHPFSHSSGHRPPNNMPWYWEDTAISSACSCLSIFAPSTTKIVTTTLKTSTFNIVSTISLQPVITRATQLSPNGPKFGSFTHSFNNDDAVDEADPSYFKGKTPEHSGVIEDLNFSSGQSSQINIGGQVIPSAFQAVLAQGYFLARTVGTYKFTTSGDIVDNWVFLWHGNRAYSNWDKNNTDYESFGGRPEPNVDGSLTLTLDAGDAVPVTFLWLNGAGQGTSNLYITTPEGHTFSNTTGWFIQACSDSTFS